MRLTFEHKCGQCGMTTDKEVTIPVDGTTMRDLVRWLTIDQRSSTCLVRVADIPVTTQVQLSGVHLDLDHDKVRNGYGDS
jgi:hypothetical protein